MERAVLLLIALGLALAVGYWGSKRKIGFGFAFFLSLLNIFVGIIAVACSKKLPHDNNNKNTQIK